MSQLKATVYKVPSTPGCSMLGSLLFELHARISTIQTPAALEEACR